MPTDEHPNPDLLALGIRQPWAELILRGAKTIDVRTQDTSVRGEIYLYAARKPAETDAAINAARIHGVELDDLPRGVIVGTVEIVETSRCEPSDATAACVPRSMLPGLMSWKLAKPERLDEPLAVRFLPYGVWFYPFKRRQSDPTRRQRRRMRDEG